MCGLGVMFALYRILLGMQRGGSIEIQDLLPFLGLWVCAGYFHTRGPLPYFGSLALLKEAKQRGLILVVKPVLDEQVSAGTYISKSLYQDVLEQVEET